MATEEEQFLILHQNDGVLDLSSIQKPIRMLKFAEQLKKLKEIKFEQHSVYVSLGFKNLTNLDISSTGSEDINDIRCVFDLQNLTHLNASKNKISSLDGITPQCIDLKVLNLCWNKLTQIESVFQHFTKLEQLDLNQNCIQKLPAFILPVKNLSLCFNSMKEKDAVLYAFKCRMNQFCVGFRTFECVTGINNLTELYLQELDLVDDEVVQFFDMNCVSLDLSSNKLRDLTHVSRNTTLKTLNVANNQLDTQSFRHILTFLELQNLNAQKNNIETLLGIIPNIQLEKLDVSFNKFPRYQGVQFAIETKIKSFMMEYYCFRHSNQVDLTRMNIDSMSQINFITQINAEHLNLSFNSLEKFALTIESLLRLNLANNQLINVSLKHMNKLEFVDVSENKLTNIELPKNSQIQELLLNSNCLDNVTDLMQQNSLKILNLAQNNIKTVNCRISIDSNLTRLDLSGNKIEKMVDITSILQAPRIKMLNLALNPITNAEQIQISNIEDLDLTQTLVKFSNQLNAVLQMPYLRSVKLQKHYSMQHETRIAFITKIKLNSLNIESMYEIRCVLGLKKLTSLNLQRNQIQTLRDLVGGCQLEELDISYNPFQNIDAIAPVRRLPKLKNVELLGTGFEKQFILQNIKQEELESPPVVPEHLGMMGKIKKLLDKKYVHIQNKSQTSESQIIKPKQVDTTSLFIMQNEGYELKRIIRQKQRTKLLMRQLLTDFQPFEKDIVKFCKSEMKRIVQLVKANTFDNSQ